MQGIDFIFIRALLKKHTPINHEILQVGFNRFLWQFSPELRVNRHLPARFNEPKTSKKPILI
jgi:hypothetical protein